MVSKILLNGSKLLNIITTYEEWVFSCKVPQIWNIYSYSKGFCPGSGMGNRDKAFKDIRFCFKKDTNIFGTISFDKFPPKWASLSSIRGRISNENQFRPQNYINCFENSEKYWQISNIISKTVKCVLWGQKTKINWLLFTDKYHKVRGMIHKMRSGKQRIT